MDRATVDRIAEQIIGASIDVHRTLGPGLLESAYEACLAYELQDRGLKVETQVALPVKYREVRLDCGYRLDLLVERLVIVELKAVAEISPLHQAQLLSYLRLADLPLGLLINFNVRVLRDGIRRLANGLTDAAGDRRRPAPTSFPPRSPPAPR